MQYSFRVGTRAAQKTPEDWEGKCEDAFLCAVYHIQLHNIPASLVINADQTGVSLLPMGNKTYAPRGSKQVPILGKEEKRQFTAMVASSASGLMLPIQCIWSGKTALSLPWKNVCAESESRGNRWVPGGDSHWSSLETMKQWVLDVLIPYIERVKREEGLPEDAMALLIIDCWSVHRSEAFLDWMKKEHKRIRIVFIPGGCRSISLFLHSLLN
ncbi:hypothetical protein M407DRAFT_81310 [Tulasnella calospora MUT 4182]|uniref:DDE-1 domain-containing protein n=1 Tax=Tulasnella calospora MUT 4182 TaxID=1051891 RepID=A0A0C3PZ48_9AGAM|nr:hypothetical protein M407DRAFT_81310 [Tulasnella calospora MUT 4182]